ncbi:MAG TPA: hypothetical protein VL100_09405 [Croceibacterium sp.]|nr:hypothetical protein [Croceibacterium sp.]
MRRAAFLAVLVLAACGEPAAPPQPARSEAPAPLPAPASLVGEYRVAGIDGDELNAPFGIALSIDGGRVSFEPTCAGFIWSYAYRDGALDIERRQEKLHHPPPPVCAVAIHPAQQKLATALDAVNRAGRTAANGIELSGNGRSVLLFSQ